MTKLPPQHYDPRTFRALTFHDAVARFRDGSDSPRAYLERALETIAAREPVVRAFAHLKGKPVKLVETECRLQREKS